MEAKIKGAGELTLILRRSFSASLFVHYSVNLSRWCPMKDSAFELLPYVVGLLMFHTEFSHSDIT
jgi:hypothetical protein